MTIRAKSSSSSDSPTPIETPTLEQIIAKWRARARDSYRCAVERADRDSYGDVTASWDCTTQQIIEDIVYRRCADELASALAEIARLRSSPDEFAEGTRRFLSGERINVSTFIDEVTTTYGYGKLSAHSEWEFPVHPKIALLLDLKFSPRQPSAAASAQEPRE